MRSRLTPLRFDATIPPMTDDESLDPRERERLRRRDREAAAAARELLKPGMGKVFKQIQDAQRKAADELKTRPDPAPRRSRRP